MAKMETPSCKTRNVSRQQSKKIRVSGRQGSRGGSEAVEAVNRADDSRSRGRGLQSFGCGFEFVFKFRALRQQWFLIGQAASTRIGQAGKHTDKQEAAAAAAAAEAAAETAAEAAVAVGKKDHQGEARVQRERAAGGEESIGRRMPLEMQRAVRDAQQENGSV
jgi:hypothetical protein